MAATADKYSHETLNDKDTTSGQTTTKNIYALQPLALEEYSSDANFKAVFFVNDVWHKKDSEGKEVVMGLLEIEPTYETYKLHQDGSETGKHSRLGKLRMNKNGTDYIVLNDGGLNTKALIRFATGSPNQIYTNYVKVICYLRSAYYLRTERFKVRIIKNGQEIYDFPLIYDETATSPAIFPAKFAANAYVGKYNLGVIGGLSAGDRVVLQVVSENGEGTFEGGTKEVDVLGAMYFALCYRRKPTADGGKGIPDWSDSTKDPSDPDNYDEVWAVLVSEDMYYHNTANPLVSGVLDRLFTSPDNELIGVTSEEWLQGAELHNGETIEDAYDKALAAIGDGWYFGIPFEGVSGTTPVWVGITTTSLTAKNMNWHGNVYVPANYTIKLSFDGNYNRVTGVYTVYLRGTFAGSVPSGTAIYLSIYPEISIAPETTPVSVTAIYSGSATQTLYTFTTTDANAMYMTYRTMGNPSPSNVDNQGYLNKADEAMVRVSTLPDAT